MSLPPENIPWHALDGSIKGKRIGLMLDLGFGTPLDQEVRDVVTDAARRFEEAGAIVRPVGSVLTQEMLQGLDAFLRARSWDDISKVAPDERKKTLPYILEWAEGGAHVSGLDVIRG